MDPFEFRNRADFAKQILTSLTTECGDGGMGWNSWAVKPALRIMLSSSDRVYASPAACLPT
ncbi:MAG: hypothetical protein DMG99_00240 [Acidobacteria bacterium]|nr:MAG: hypothetical protein DMG99_00240 [Acidobacteriota bacterium]